MSDILSFVYTNSKDPAEPSLYIKFQDIGTGRSETPLIKASRVVIYHFIFKYMKRLAGISPYGR